MRLLDLVLIHYGREVIRSVYSRKQQNDCIGSEIGKPEGLWVSVKGDDDWESWCRGEGFRLAELDKQSRVYLSPNAKIMWIKTAKGLDRFSQTYGRETAWRTTLIDWEAVARAGWQGIVIAPYIRERRLSMQKAFWYYSWDCASGCFWDKEAVDRVEPYRS